MSPSQPQPLAPPPPPQSDAVPLSVAVRLKPNPENAPTSVVAVPGQNSLILTPPPGHPDESLGGRTLSLSHPAGHRVFAESVSQETVFASSVQQYLGLVLVGYDLTLVAYGQGQSGKTYTLVGADLPLATNEADLGLIPRVVRSLYQGK